MSGKNTYDTLFMISYALGARGKQYNMIPTSTKYDWRTKSHDHIIGFEQMSTYAQLAVTAEDNKGLKQMIFSLYRLFLIYRTIVNRLPDRNKQLFEVKDRIVTITERWLGKYKVKGIADMLGISQQQYTSWKNGFYCRFSPVKFCRRVITNQLTIKEVDLIKKFVSDPKYLNWSLISIYYKLIRETNRFFSDKTFYKYVDLLGLRKRKKKHTENRVGPRASKPLELLHMDISEYWITDNIKAYLHIIMDNYSRKILGVKVALNKSASLALNNLKEVYQSLDLAQQQQVMIMMNDGGSENNGETKAFIESLPNMIQHFAVRNKHNCSNNMVEALISKVKQCFIYTKDFTGLEHFITYLMEAIGIYNKEMPLAAVDGRTPDEAFKGVIPFSDQLSKLIQIAHYQRVEENKRGDCLPD